MLAYGAHQQLGYAASAVLGQDEDVADIAEDRVVGDHAGEADLLTPIECAEAE